jgi:hypothetical protein
MSVVAPARARVAGFEAVGHPLARRRVVDLWAYGGLVLLGVSGLWAMSATVGEESLVAADRAGALPALEATVAGHPGDAEATRALAQAYVDAHQPGLAVALVERAPGAVADDLRVRHAYARALVDEGRSDDALAAERSVLTACGPGVEAGTAAPGCDRVLFASALRRAGILEELVLLGVRDAQAHPEETLAAYRNATREARVIAE